MASNGPKFSVVGATPSGEPGESQTSPSAESAPQEASGGSLHRRLLWLLAALVLILCVFLVERVQHARDLDRRVQALTTDLADARTDLESQRQHLLVLKGEVGVVHAAASELERRLAALRELADRDPLETR